MSASFEYLCYEYGHYEYFNSSNPGITTFLKKVNINIKLFCVCLNLLFTLLHLPPSNHLDHVSVYNFAVK